MASPDPSWAPRLHRSPAELFSMTGSFHHGAAMSLHQLQHNLVIPRQLLGASLSAIIHSRPRALEAP